MTEDDDGLRYHGAVSTMMLVANEWGRNRMIAHIEKRAAQRRDRAVEKSGGDTLLVGGAWGDYFTDAYGFRPEALRELIAKEFGE